jgi:hypothetical protein
MTKPGTCRVADGAAVAMTIAKEEWTAAARSVLEQVARTFHATIQYSDLAEDVQAVTGVRTRTLMHHWIGEVLGGVSHDCRRRGEPLLSSLCVDTSGSVGPGYGVLIEELGGTLPEDLDIHAAEERLACYRHFGAEIPTDGGRPALTPQLAERRRRAARHAEEERPRGVCPTCFMPLPSNGVCGNCP